MEGFAFFRDVLAGGSDLAIIAFAFFLWKIERRLFKVELQIKALCVDDNRDVTKEI